ncbi:protein of unknown function [Aminobacter niigataensis]|nr:protein of unknown function [Aminobacter niigataensis]
MTDITRVGTYDLEGGTAQVIALDANPLARPIAPKGIVMAPGQRADIALRVPDSADEIVSLTPENTPRAAASRAVSALGCQCQAQAGRAQATAAQSDAKS